MQASCAIKLPCSESRHNGHRHTLDLYQISVRYISFVHRKLTRYDSWYCEHFRPRLATFLSRRGKKKKKHTPNCLMNQLAPSLEQDLACSIWNLLRKSWNSLPKPCNLSAFLQNPAIWQKLERAKSKYSKSTDWSWKRRQTIFQNVINYSPSYTALRSRRLERSITPPWKSPLSHTDKSGSHIHPRLGFLCHSLPPPPWSHPTGSPLYSLSFLTQYILSSMYVADESELRMLCFPTRARTWF